MPERTLAYMAAKSLAPHPKNPKGHDMDLLRASLGRWGYTMPVLLCERSGYLAAGHGRRALVIDDEDNGRPPADGVEVDVDGHYMIPVIRGWSSVDDAELEAYVIADNATTVAGGWIEELLAESLKVVRDTPLGLEGTGYTPVALDDMLQRLGQVAPDFRPDPTPDRQGQLDRLEPITCPACGHEFQRQSSWKR